MMKITKMGSVCLLLAFLIANMGSCTKTKEANTQTTVSTEAIPTTVTEETTSGFIEPEIPESDYGGQTFTILYPNWSLYNDYYFSEGETGETVNDALYKRTMDVEEKLNIKIEPFCPGYIDKIYPMVKKTVMGGLDTYDLVLTHCATSLGSYVADGLVKNWNEIPFVDMTKPYWNQSAQENMELYGMLPFAASDFIIPDVTSIFFHKGLIESYQLENPYELVLDGKWTWDKLEEMAKKITKDTNGDGKYDIEDQYGFVAEEGWQFASISQSANQYIIQKDGDGNPTIVINTDKMSNLIDKIHRLVRENNTSFTWKYLDKYDPNQGGMPPIRFDAGKALFYMVPLSLASTFRTMEIDFGILPFPKYDEAQEEYITTNWSGFMCVPQTVRDLELVGKTVELLSAENRRTVMPAFYEILLGQKVSRDKDSQKMLDIIFGNTVFDLGVNIELYPITQNIVFQTSPDFASYCEKNKNSWQKTLDKFSDAFRSS